MKKLKVTLLCLTIGLGILTELLPAGKEYSNLDLIRTMTGLGCICCLFGLLLIVQEDAKQARQDRHKGQAT